MRKIRLIKGLGFLEALSLGIGFIIGSGIFIMPLLAAKEAGTLSLIAWLIGGIFSILTGLVFAELAAKIPKAGGPYAYAHKAFGNKIGFLTGWMFWISYWGTIAAETLAIALYLELFLPGIAYSIRIFISLILMLSLTFINFKGVKSGGEIEDILTIIKIGALLFFIIFGLFFIKTGNFVPLYPENKQIFSIIGSSTILVLWAYLGAEIITVPEEEIKTAKKTIRKAIMTSIIVTNLLYLLVVFVLLGIMNWKSYENYSTIADIAQEFMGNIGGYVLSFGGLVSIIGALDAVILGCARISDSMSDDKLFPKFFGHIHPKYKTPDYALFIQTLLAVILILFIPDFKLIAELTVLFVLVIYSISCFAVIKLIKRTKGELLILKTEIVPILALIFCLILLTQFSFKLWSALIVLVISGYFIYILEMKKVIK
jgi:amino acid transporter